MTHALFTAFGVELEYMIVAASSLDVLPVCDRVIHAVTGEYINDVERDDLAWSNELALHVIELKTNGPASELAPLPARFQQEVQAINDILQPLGGRLMPTGMHPWMDPHREMKLWPHEYNAVYEAFNRIFDCRGHGWANLQSVHLNLPFASDEEFGRLHAAIRLALPILPALAASSPVIERRTTGKLDNRLDVYRHNAARVPSVSGQVIPEAVYSRAAYEELLRSIYDDIAPLDPEGVLQYEWLNARGAIARFDRDAIEIRVLDVQECPQADVAICSAIVALLQALADQRWTPTGEQQAVTTESLAAIFRNTVEQAERNVIRDAGYLRHFGVASDTCTAGELWQHIVATLPALQEPSPLQQPLQVILEQGPLARRITAAVTKRAGADALRETYSELCNCLAKGIMFQPE